MAILAEKKNTDRKSDYSTADLRKHVHEAFGRAAFLKNVVRISHHKKPYVAIISDEDAEGLELLKEKYGNDVMKKLAILRDAEKDEIADFFAKIDSSKNGAAER